MSTYSLSLDGRGMGGSNVVFSNTSTGEIKYLGRTISVSLYGVSFCRKMYQPGHIEAEILMNSVTSKTKAIDIDLLHKMLIHRPVQLSVDSTVVATKYFIHEISPQFSVIEQKVEEEGEMVDGYSYTIYAKLDIYSIDYILSQTPVGKAYLGQSLCADIVKGTLPSYNLAFTYPKSDTENTTSNETVELGLHHRLTNLVYTNSNSKLEEYLQPYLVQYNESFYDFVKRVANRCGEALYFEDGCLQMGLPTKDDDSAFKGYYTIDNLSRVIYHRISDGPLTVTDYYRDGSKNYNSDGTALTEPAEFNSEQTDRGKDGYPTDSFSTEGTHAFSSELASPEQYILLYKNKFKRDFGEKPREYWWNQPAEKGVAWLGALLNCTSLLDLLTKLALDLTRSGVKYKTMTDAANKKGNDIIGENALSSSNTYATLFTKVDNSLLHWLTVKHYSDIRSSQQAQMRKMICVDMGTNFKAAKLGDFVKVPGDDTTYVVVQIEMASSVPWQKNYRCFEGGSTGTPAVNYQYIYAIPLDGTTFYPPLLPGPLFRQSGSQLAFVTDNEDPTGQGRVRVRFAWQGRVASKSPDKTIKELKKAADDAEAKMDSTKSDLQKLSSDTVSYSIQKKSDGTEEVVVSATKKTDADQTKFNNAKTAYQTAVSTYLSAYDTWKHDRDKYLTDSTPWVRMVTPMATEGCGGMFFRPEVGDEVMVNFEQGNVDHPYVEGTLFSKDATIPYPGTRVIASRNGHTVRFLDPDDATLLMAGAYPGFKFLKTFGLSFLQDMTIDSGEGVRKALGGIELTDQYGFYRVAMSSHDRQVSVSSPFGDVKIDAFTGITLKAPNGNIKIEGKNIDIKAGNRLNLSSGNNIKDGGFFNSNLGGALLDNVLGGFFDLSLLRSIVEVFVRPVDGTLEVKSNRYLLLEAGEGKARPQDPDAYRKPEKWTTDADADLAEEMLAFAGMIKFPNLFVERISQEFVDTHISLRRTIRSFTDKFYTHDNEVFVFPSTASDFCQQVYGWDFGDYSRESFENACLQGVANTELAFGWDTRVTQEEVVNGIIELAEIISKMKRFLTHSYPIALEAVDNVHISNLHLQNFFSEAKPILELTNPHASDSASNSSRTSPLDADPGSPASSGLYGQIIKPLKDFFEGVSDTSPLLLQVSVDEFKDWKKSVKRRLVCYVIEKCHEDAKNRPFNSFACQYQFNGSDTKPVNQKFPFRDDDWAKYLNSITFKPVFSIKESVKASGIVTKLKQMAPLESRVWSSLAKGQIILSENALHSMTINSDEGLLESYASLHHATEGKSDKEARIKLLDTEFHEGVTRLYS